MNEASHFILLLWLILAAIFAARMIEVMAPQFMRWYRQVSHPAAKSLAGFAGLVALAAFVVSKDFQGGPISPTPLNGGVLESAELQSGSSTPALTEAQCRARFALTSATNVTHDFSAPANAVFCDLGSGVHDEAYWIPVSFNPEGTATNSRWGRAVCAAPSGMVLLDDVPDRLAPSLPDFSAQSRTASSPFSKRLRACCLHLGSSGIPLRPTAPSSSPGTTYSSDATRTPSPTSSSSFSKAETSSTASASTRTPTPPS